MDEENKSFDLILATQADLNEIMDIINGAIHKRKLEGSDQWQDGYPNKLVIEQDIHAGNGYIYTNGEIIAGYAAVIFDDDPAYKIINGAWLNDDPYVVIHRLAVLQKTAMKGIGTKMMQAIEAMIKASVFTNIRVDTNYDNASMLRVFEKLEYQYCGMVTMRTGERQAFQKML